MISTPGKTTTADAYAMGRHDVTAETDRYGTPEANRMSSCELREAVNNWTAARWDHGHTSFWGSQHVRSMRAYWLGALRRRRELAGL